MTRLQSLVSTLLIAVALLAAPTGCNTSSCTENQSSLPLAGFYDTAGDAISVDSLQVSGVGAPADSALYDGKTILSKIYLPFRSTTDVTSYCFRYMHEETDIPALNDTITFGYTSKPYFTSEECGVSYIYTIDRLSYTTHIIDSVAITDSIISPLELERIKIFFRTSSGDSGNDEPGSDENNPTPNTRP